MKIEDSKAKVIYRFDKDGKASYQIRLNKKNQDGSYTNGYMSCRFSHNAEVPNKTKIKLIDAWLDFWIDENKKTHIYLFINKYEVEEKIENMQTKTDYEGDIVIKDEDLPF